MASGERFNGIDTQLLDDAQTLVLGVVTARHNKSKGDVNTLISGYMDDASTRGISEMLSWATLFSASAMWVDTLIECRAEHHGLTHQQTVHELSLIMAGGNFSE